MVITWYALDPKDLRTGSVKPVFVRIVLKDPFADSFHEVPTVIQIPDSLINRR